MVTKSTTTTHHRMCGERQSSSTSESVMGPPVVPSSWFLRLLCWRYPDPEFEALEKPRSKTT